MEPALVLIPFILAGGLPVIGRFVQHKRIHWLTAGTMALLFIWVISLIPRISATGPITIDLPWVQSLGLSLSLYIDALAAVFGLLVTGIGAAVFMYTGYYMQDDPRIVRFTALLSAFTGSMLGVIFSGNLLLLFVCWELTSLFSFTLIGFNGKDPQARSSASQALVITAGGGLALFVGLMLMGIASESFNFSDILSLRLDEHPWYSGIALLVMAGGFTKSAQFPFHFWLPGGMTAPTPASAFLHSATMVKAGVYLFARLYPTLGDTDLWFVGLTSIGLITMLLGAFNSIFKRDLKSLLAYATVSWLGTLVFLLGLRHEAGLTAAVVGVIGHALYKSPLFMVVGAIDHATGTRNLDRLGGLFSKMRGSAIITILAALSMAGVIPFLGFVAKEQLIEVTLHTGPPVLLLVVMASAVFTVTAALILVWDVFFRPPPPPPPKHRDDTESEHHFHAPPALMMIGPGIIATMSLLTGVALPVLITPLVSLVTPNVSLYLFHGFNDIFMLSLLALAMGLGVFLLRNYWLRWGEFPIPSGGRIYNLIIHNINRLGDTLLLTQSGKLSHYLAIMLGVVGVLLVLPATQYFSTINLQFNFNGSSDLMKLVLLALTVIATLASILYKRHLLSTLSLGVSGYAIGGIFLLEPGPDVAMVQILVETLAAVLVIVMLGRISEKRRRQAADLVWGNSRRTVQRDLLVSVLVAVGVSAFTLAAITEREDFIARWYIENAESVGVTDIVGAIITDFRGTDTLIEITVFSMAALGVLTVLYLTHSTPGRKPFRQRTGTSRISTPLTRLAATIMLPVSFLIALAHLFYAGSAPGDGFTAGVIGGISVALWYEVFGYGSRRLQRLHPEWLIGVGLMLALVNAIAPLLYGGSLLEHNDFGNIALPAGLHFSSSTVYEIAIFLTVFSSVITIINAMNNPEGIEEL